MKSTVFFLIVLCCFVQRTRAEVIEHEQNTFKAVFSRDTVLSSVKAERKGNSGKNSRLKVKSLQEMVLFDVSLPDMQRQIISSAILHVRSAAPRKAPLARITVSSLAAPWVEGSSSGYKPEQGASCFVQAQLGRKDWAYPGSSVMDVVMGRGNTLWKFADCTPPDDKGWQSCGVDPDVVAARVSGLSYGFLLYDDVGTTWSLKSGEFKQDFLPNRFLYSRESLVGQPFLEIHTGIVDKISPEVVKDIFVETKGYPPGEAVLSWKTPPDSGGGKTLGFKVKYQRSQGEWVDVPRYLIPMAAQAGQPVRLRLRDLSLGDAERINISVTAVDSVGNQSQEFIQPIILASAAGYTKIIDSAVAPFASQTTKYPEVGGLKVAVIDLLDKIDPVSGSMIPPRRNGYKNGNHLFSAQQHLIRLQAARNETIGFQINLEGTAQDTVQVRLSGMPSVQTRFFQAGYVRVGGEEGQGDTFLPDPLVEIDGGLTLPSNAGPLPIAGQKNTSLFCELYVPHDVPAGDLTGKLLFTIGEEQLALSVQLKIWDFTLPDKLSFVPEMNAYSTVSPLKGYAYYRLAHEHRCCLNRLPYGWSGSPSFAPDWEGDSFGWAAWDRAVGPLLDGAAFSDLPRSGEPVDVLYLPFNENWPVNIFDHYSPSYWADNAFDDEYKKALIHSFSLFAKHSVEKGWHETMFQFYLNNKIQYRKNNRKSSAPWRLDEPVDIKDFYALRWYGNLFHEAVAPYAEQTRFWYRADISYSQFGGNILQGITDIDYLGGNTQQKSRMKEDERLNGGGYFAEYGSVNNIDEENTQPVLWCLSAWSRGATGVLPWQTIGNGKSWKQANQLALFYPRGKDVAPSLRLKAFTVGQQTVEYLILLSQTYEQPFWWTAQILKKELGGLKAEVQKSSLDDAGRYRFSQISPEKIWNIRYRIAQMISKKSPPYRRALVRYNRSLSQSKVPVSDFYIPTIPTVSPLRPDVDSFRP